MEGHARLKSNLSIIAHSQDLVELRYGVWNPSSFTIRDESNAGRLYIAIASLNGRNSHGDIARVSGLSRSEVEALIDYLDQLGVIEFRSTGVFEHYTQYALAGLAPHSKSDRLTGDGYRVAIVGDGDVTQEVEAALRRIVGASTMHVIPESNELFKTLSSCDSEVLADGLKFQQFVQRFSEWDNSLLVLAQSTINPISSALINRICLARNITWLYCAVDGPFIFIGPTFVPNKTACYECLERRVTMNLREGASYQRYKVALLDGRVSAASKSILHSAIASLLSVHASLELLNYFITSSNFTVESSSRFTCQLWSSHSRRSLDYRVAQRAVPSQDATTPEPTSTSEASYARYELWEFL